MNPTEPPEEREADALTPTIAEGLSLDDLRGEFDERDLSNLRAFLARAEAESRHDAAARKGRLESLGPFRDLEEIGRGGMGVVYRARDPETGRDVAVKVPSPSLMLSPAARRRFDNEAEAVGRLDHPAIVAHRPLNAEDKRLYLVSDFCDGLDLERWLQARRRPVPPREAARIIRALADAVAHAHRRGVLHRDVKPSNVLLPGSSESSLAEALAPKLTDFGLAKLIDDEESPSAAATATGIVMGSPPYMAPEQASGRQKAVDRRTDVYGLGAVLYELLTARPPLKGETPAETLGMVMVEDPVPVRVLRPKVPRALEAIVLQCLEKSPDRRYPTAEALRDDLDAFLAGRRVRARRLGPVERIRRWARRRPKTAALAALALIAAAILAASTVAWTKALERGRDRSEQFAYASRVQLAERALEVGHLVRAQPILHGLIPHDGERDRREFAWRHLWDRSRREARMIFDAEVGFDYLTLSPDGSRLAYGGNSAAAIRDLNRLAPVWRASLSGMRLDQNPVFSRDGRRVALLLIDPDEKPKRKRRVESRNAADGALLGRRDFSIDTHVYGFGYPENGRINLIVAAGAPAEPSACEVWTWSDRGGMADAAKPIRFAAHRVNSADAARLLAVDRDGRLGVFNAPSRRFVPLQAASTAGLGRCDFSDDGRRVAVSRGPAGEIAIHDADDGRSVRRLPPIGAAVAQIALQPGGSTVLVRTEKQEVRLIDPARDVDVRVFEPTSEPGVETKHVRFTPDGSAFLVHRTEYQGPDHVELRSAEDGRLLGESPARYNALAGPWTIRSGPRPELIYSLGLYAWRWEWGRTAAPHPEEAFQAHDDEVWTVAYSPDGSLLATTSDNDRERATIRLRTPDGRVVREWLDDDATVSDLAFAPDARWIVTAHLSSHKSLRIRPTRGDGELVTVDLSENEWARGVIFDPTRAVVYACGDRGTVLAWDVDRRRVVWRVTPPPEPEARRARERNHDLAIAADGRRLVVVDDLGVARSLDPRDGRTRASYQGRAPLLVAEYAPDGGVVAVADREGWVHLLDAATLRPLQDVPVDDGELRALAFSPDGRTLAAAGLGRVVRLLDPFTGDELASLVGHEAQVNSLAFSPDGQTLASGDHAGIVRFWRGPRTPAR